MRTREYLVNGSRDVRAGSCQYLNVMKGWGATGEWQKVRLKRSAGPNHEPSCVACKEFELYPAACWEPLKDFKRESDIIMFLF